MSSSPRIETLVISDETQKNTERRIFASSTTMKGGMESNLHTMNKFIGNSIQGNSLARVEEENGVQRASIENERFFSGRILQKVVDIVNKEKLVTGIDETRKVIEFRHPHELLAELDLDITAEGCSDGALCKILEDTSRYSVKTQHPHFYNQLYGAIEELGLAGAWMSEAFNTNMHTFEVAPVFNVIEHRLLQQLATLFGWGENADGMFCPGGSMSNMYGMALARYQQHPEVKLKGTFGMKPQVVFTSDQSHYSVLKAAHWLGIGYDNVVQVASDEKGCMIPTALKKALKDVRKEGREPFFVHATAGTTVFGAFDDLEVLSAICREEGIWLHVDACWGGTAILSRKHKKLMRGIELVDSISWNPHKMLGAPLQCSLFFVKHKGLMHRCNSASATYLFHQDKFYDVTFDSGDRSIQCGRKVDSYKLWLMLKGHGLNYLGNKVDLTFEAAEYLYSEVKRREGFEPVLDGIMCTNVCFWFIPPSMRNLPRDDAWWARLAKVAPKVKERMMLEGKMMVSYQPMPNKGIVNFFRMILVCFPTPTQAHMDQVLDNIEKLAMDL